MASTPLQSCLFKSNPQSLKLLSPPPTSPLFLFLLLLSSLLLALSLLHLHDLILSHSLSPSFHLLSPLLPDQQALLSHLLHLHHHYLAFLFSPCSIFIFVNLIVFTLLLKSFYFPSTPATGFFDFVLEDHCTDNGVDASPQLGQHLLPRHDDFYPSRPHQHYVLSQYGTPEEHHVLSFSADYDEDTYPYTSMQAGYSMHGALPQCQNDVRPPGDAKVAGGTVQSAPALSMPLPANLTLLPKEPKNVTETRDLQESRSEEKSSRPSSIGTAPYASSAHTTQSIIINMELVPTKRNRIPPTNMSTSTQAFTSRPSLAPPPLVKASTPPSSASVLSHRPPSSPRLKKSTQSSAKDGRHEASLKTIQLDGEKEPLNVNEQVEQKNSMIRSKSDQRLSQMSRRAEDVSTVITSPSSLTNKSHLQRAQSVRGSGSANTIADTSSTANKPHIQRAQSLRSSSAADTITNATTSFPSSPASYPHIQRAQSLREHSTPHVPHNGKVRRSPSLSESLDGLSDAEANKCFSDFIAHRFAMMNKELD